MFLFNRSRTRNPGWQRWLFNGVLVVLLASLSVGLSGAWWDFFSGNNERQSSLPTGDPVTNGESLLQYSLPIDNPPVRQLQQSLEDIATQLRARRRWGAIRSDVKAAARVLQRKEDEILASIAPEKQAQAQKILDDIRAGVDDFKEIAEVKDKEAAWIRRGELISQLGDLEELMVDEFPFEVPEEYSDLPQLQGRATIEMETNKGNLTLVVDGYSAPITAGNFVDLVQRNFYDGLEFIRSEQDYVLQAGDPPGPEEGFVDPETGTERTIPLEIKPKSEKEPIYGFTFEELGLYKTQPELPFSAYGTVAMARPEENNNGGSSQFFFFLFEPDLTPAGANLLDGRYAVFGYVIDGKDVLETLQAGDKIMSAQVTKGLENLVVPQEETETETEAA
ncbi:peptidylprolyl isomerase [Geitlerinema sp. PCC 9228]|jgi:peptidylprolyl isomerase|uniref:peptidylprolyl isomerase n=1 Tax=Geitlerinema sp. PCC 9228 TaxID=111611 RepID=UPI0008F98E85|nr:peptidylprolyl isomerase [Geitlerinema sp. PCC 9228]